MKEGGYTMYSVPSILTAPLSTTCLSVRVHLRSRHLGRLSATMTTEQMVDKLPAYDAGSAE